MVCLQLVERAHVPRGHVGHIEAEEQLRLRLVARTVRRLRACACACACACVHALRAYEGRPTPRLPAAPPRSHRSTGAPGKGQPRVPAGPLTARAALWHGAAMVMDVLRCGHALCELVHRLSKEADGEPGQRHSRVLLYLTEGVGEVHVVGGGGLIPVEDPARNKPNWSTAVARNTTYSANQNLSRTKVS